MPRKRRLSDSPPPGVPVTDDEPPKKRTRSLRKRPAVVEPPPSPDSPPAETDDEEPPKKKTRSPRKRAAQPPPMFVIPPVLRKTTTFRGRLGYACLNTVLRSLKPAKKSIFCSRTCRIETIKKNGIEAVKALGEANARDLAKMIQWNEEHAIRLFRISSEMFPFASHPLYGYSLDYARPLLKAAGDLAKEYGHRLTAHPGQFTQLGSPKEEVVASSIRELEYHCDMMEAMGMDQDSVLVIHGGGVYGDQAGALERIKSVVQQRLPARVRARLVLENDELSYSAIDLLPLCESLDIPLIFDYHHDMLKPSYDASEDPPRPVPPSEIIARANAIFARRGIKPKQHLSEPRPGAVTLMERRAHADRCTSLPADLPDDMDLMIEAKDKEQAVFELYRIYGLADVKEEDLRPADENQTKETKGRKSNKSKNHHKEE